jgi:hypothetical protein
MIRERLKSYWAALRPDTEEAKALRNALQRVEAMRPRKPLWKRLLWHITWLAAIALIGWVAFVLL